MSKILGGVLEDVGEQLAEMGKSAVKQTVKAPLDLAKAGAKQVKGTTDQTQPQVQNGDLNAEEKAKTKEFVKDLYKPSEKGQTQDKVQSGKTEETKEQKLAKLRQELHANYYQSLIHPPKPPEEKPAEKVEREKKEEEFELQQKEKKKPQPLAVQRAAQKAEKFPGASG